MSNTKDFEIKNTVLYKFTDNSAKSAIVPDGITDISYRAFDYLTNLETVELPQSVNKICNCAFEGSFSLSKINIPEGVVSIGVSAFAKCEKLKELTVPESVTDIGHNAFDGCYSLKLHINGNPSVGKNAFRYVGQVIAPEISFSAFESADDKKAAVAGFINNMSLYKDSAISEGYKKYITSQKKRYLPEILKKDDVTALSFFAEYKKINVKNLDEEYLAPAQENNAINCIGYLLEWKNKNISQNDVEKEIERTLKKDPFNVTDMKKLWDYEKLPDGTISLTNYKGKEKEIIVPERIGGCIVSAIGTECFYVHKRGIRNSRERMEIERIILPESIRTIDSDAFKVCKSLKEINIPNGVTSIGRAAFFDCQKLANINIPDSMTLIGNSAFKDCINLKNVTVSNPLTEIRLYAFAHCYKLTLSAPAGSYAERYVKENNIPFVVEE